MLRGCREMLHSERDVKRREEFADKLQFIFGQQIFWIP